MRRLACVVGVAMLVALLGLAVSGCGEKKIDAEKPAAKPAEKSAAAAEIAQKNCPVMAGPINKDIYADHNGRRIYFCCGGCVDEFKKAPEKYIAKVDAELKAKPAEKPATE